MNTDRDPVRDRIDAAERMLHQARHEYTRGNAEDATEFLAAARRNVDRAEESMKPKPAQVSGVTTVAIVDHQLGPVPQKVAQMVVHRPEVAHAR